MTTKCIFYEKDLAQCLAQIKNLIQDSLHRKERESGGREGKEGERRRTEGRGARKGAGQREKKRREIHESHRETFGEDGQVHCFDGCDFFFLMILPVLFRYIRRTALYKFKVYSIMI